HPQDHGPRRELGQRGLVGDIGLERLGRGGSRRLVGHGCLRSACSTNGMSLDGSDPTHRARPRSIGSTLAVRPPRALSPCLGRRPVPVRAPEGGGFRQYAMDRPPVDPPISDLAQQPDSYDQRAVRTKGRFDLALEYGRDRYLLQDNMGAKVLVMPVREFQVEFDDVARTLGGKEVQVVGLFRSAGGGGGGG